VADDHRRSRAQSFARPWSIRTLPGAKEANTCTLLAKLPVDVDARIWMGLAKKHSAFEAKAQGWRGKLWGKRGKEVAVRDRAHQLNAYDYILAHAKEGAWVWVWKRQR
jgi:hypothetical protein